MISYLSADQVLLIHEAQIELFGGSAGLRDRNGLESAVIRPAMTFGGDELYPDLASKAAAIMHSLVQNHPFIDGNKRVGSAAAELFLILNGARVAATDKDFEGVTMSVARGELGAEELAIWFRQRIVLPE